MAIIRELETKFGISASYHRITAFNISYSNKKISLCVATYISKEARANFNQPVEEIDIEIPYGDFTSFLNVNPIERGYLWLKENVIGFEDAVDDFDVLEPIIEPVASDELDPTTKIRGIFPYHKVLLAYYSGSIAYGINDEHSDTDVTVVLEDFRDNIHLNLGEVDLFIFSKERFLARHSFDETITAYHRSSTDTFLSLEKTLIYMDPDFKTTVDKLLNINHRMFLLKSLEAELEYGKARYEITKAFKSHYHFFRYRGIIAHYEKTGRFELVCPEPWHSYMIDYKNNWDNIKGSKYYGLLEESIHFIENYIEGMKRVGLG